MSRNDRSRRDPAGALDLEVIMADGENSNAVAILVTVAAPARRSVRLNITLLETVLRGIDHYAQSRGMTRPAFLLRASLRAMEQDAKTA